MKKNLQASLSFLIIFFCLATTQAQNLLTMSPGFESGSGSGPGSTLDGGMWFRTNQGFAGAEVQNQVYRKTENPAPQQLTAYLEGVTPNDPHFNASWKMQAINNQNLTSTLENGKEYKVSFYYQNSAGHTFSISIENTDGSANIGNHVISTQATEWTLSEFEFTMNTAVLTDGRFKINLGLNAGTTRIDNIVLMEEGVPPPPPVALNLLTLSPGFEAGTGSGPGSSLDGGNWFRTHQGFAGNTVENLVYRKTENPAPQQLTAYLEGVTPNDPHFNAVWKLQAINNQNLTNTLENGKTYKVNFYYQNSASHTFSISIENVDGSGNLVNHNVSTAATEWTFSEFEFTMDNTRLTDGRLKINLGANAGMTRIDNVVLFDPTTLPVSLVNYAAIPYGSGAKVYWETSSETNNSHFLVSKSFNGTSFEVMERIEPNETGKYEVVDYKVQQGNVYYQLTQFDRDGASKNLGIRAVKIGGIIEGKTHFYPNPVEGKTITMRTENLSSGNYQLIFTDYNGRVIGSRNIRIQEGTNQMNFELPINAKSGLFNVSLKGNGMHISEKIFIK